MPAAVIIRPTGSSRRLGRAAAIAPSEVAGSGDVDTVARWLDRSWVMGRDGSLAGTGGTGGSILCPRTGATVTGPCSFDLAVPGYGGLKMVMAWDAITSLCPALASTPGLASNTLDATTLMRTLVEDTSTGNHYGAGTATLATSTPYRLAFRVARLSGARHAVVYVNKTSRAGIGVNLDTGAVTAIAVGTGAVANPSATLRADGFWYCEATINATADWGAATTILAGVSTSATSLSSHTGDGSSLIFQGVTLTPLTDYAPLMAEGITRAADSWIWTLPAALPQDCEITHIGMQPYADGDMGIADQTWFCQNNGSNIYPRMQRTTATILSSQDYDASAPVTKQITRTLPSARTTFIQRARRVPTGIDAGYGASLTGTSVAIGSAPWVGATQLFVGRYFTAGRASRAANALIVTPGGCTQAERDAAARFFHNVPLPVAA